MVNNLPKKEIVESVRQQYPKGCRVALDTMSDPYTDLKPGDEGTVSFVDDIATIHIQWDSGSNLGAAYGVDVVKRV